MRLSEHDDYWSVGVEEADVTRVSFDFAVTFLVRSESLSLELRIQDSFVLVDPDGSETVIGPEGGPEQLAPALSLLHTGLVHLYAYKDGRLKVELQDGSWLRVNASEEFEPWELTATDGTRIVSTPGDGLAVWTRR
ncbi:DUF6188 family protein [Streptomyces montanisoli]|uniref:Uncharacterized protein n=1 Tax=Streptomyces montanisoli TaxID=2798581 RepID=A0A940MBZ0_9ACTN|nr:DUF6188 family protein [Streptomyces montanisoli]MBP0455928.1 hypothetical protein [Streptomyces montanisoli]